MTQQSFNTLFDSSEAISPDTVLLPGFLLPHEKKLLEQIQQVTGKATFRQMLTPGGKRMSAALSNCGQRGWVTDRQGYRYQTTDPETGKPWPGMPELFRYLAVSAADKAGYAGFAPDVCLINRYVPGARMSLHQDRDEKEMGAPIVSFSLGLTATFLWGGLKRSDRADRLLLQHGDVIVWGRADRLRYHGIAPLPASEHPLTGAVRYNLTFRQTGF